MFSPPVGALAAGGVVSASRGGSVLTPLDGLRPLPSGLDGTGTGSAMQAPGGNRGRRESSANSKPLGSSTRIPNNMLTSTIGQATNLSEADNIKVAVRVRPIFPHEVEKGGTSVVQVNSNTTVKVVVPGPAGTTMQRDFAFHACLGPDVTQTDVLHLCGVPQLLDAALAGYNVTIFAYGQTGSGKTYSMSGREEVIRSDSYTGDAHDGIMTRAIQHLFAAIAKKTDTKYALAASYLEIYNEGIYDLLNLKAKNLPVKWDATLGFFVPGLKQATCTKIDTMMDVIRTGMKHRHVGSHELNIESSRSHAIMTIFVHATPTDPSAADYGTPRIGKISFVDLAGSERLKDSKSEGAMLKETTNINKSLFVLGKVISALAERDSTGTSAHIPYRDSKLTKLLMDSLGGNALALMIACCSPASTAVEETLSTLSYATRAKNIQNRPTVQYDPKEAQIANLRREIELLRQENAYLREQIRGGGGNPGPQFDCATPNRSQRPTADGTAPPGSAAQERHNYGAWPSLVDGGGGAGAGSGGGGSAPPNRPPSAAAQAFPQARLMSPRVGGSVDALRASLSSSNGAHLEPLRMSVDASASSAPGLMASSSMGRRLSSTGPVDDDLMRRLNDTQSLLSRFSEENGRLAKENDRLRAGRQLLSQEHGEVLDEIETLRSKLTQLEGDVRSGTQTPTAVKAALQTAMSGQQPDTPNDGYRSGGASSSSANQSPMLRHQTSLGAGGSPLPSAGGSSGQYGQFAFSPAVGTPGTAGGGGHPWTPGGPPGAMMGSAGAPPSPGAGGSGGGLAPGSRGGYGGQYQDWQVQGAPYYPPGSAMQMQMQPQMQMHPQSPMQMQPHMQMQMQPQSPMQMQQPHMQMQQPHMQMQQPHPPASGTPGGYAVHHPASPALHSQPPPNGPHGPGGGGGGGAGPGVANVIAVGGGAGNASSTRTRTKYGSSGGPGGGGSGAGGRADDSIVVADPGKLALLLGNGPVEPAVPVRPLPVGVPDLNPAKYANPAKAHHAQRIQEQIQRSGSTPSSPQGAAAAGGGQPAFLN